MTWTTPPTFTDGAVLTGAQLNILRDDLNETAAGKATTAGSLFVGTGTNSLKESSFQIARAGSSPETTTSASYVELTTLLNLTVTTSTRALVIHTPRLSTSTVDGICFGSYVVSGASTIAASDNNAFIVQSSTVSSRARASAINVEDGLTAGSNTFKACYKVTAGTLTRVSADLIVLAL